MLSNTFLSFTLGFHVSPTYRIKPLHISFFFGLEVFYVPLDTHSVTLIVHLLSCLHTTWVHPSAFAFSYVPDNGCHTTLFAYPVCTLSVLQGDSYHDSLHLPLGCDQFLKLRVAKWSSLTAICHYWKYTFIKCFPPVSQPYFCLASCPAYRMHSIPVPFLLFISCTWSWSLITIFPRYT